MTKTAPFWSDEFGYRVMMFFEQLIGSYQHCGVSGQVSYDDAEQSLFFSVSYKDRLTACFGSYEVFIDGYDTSQKIDIVAKQVAEDVFYEILNDLTFDYLEEAI